MVLNLPGFISYFELLLTTVLLVQRRRRRRLWERKRNPYCFLGEQLMENLSKDE